MEISFNTAPGNLRKDIGFGVAGFNIIRSLQRLGHTVPYDDHRSQVQINFSQPEWFHLRKNQYQIGYTPWESSVLPESWAKTLNKCDEVWTTSEKCREWFLDGGVKGPITVYKHGIEDIWTPHRRRVQSKLRFLHIGEPAPRKGGQIAMEAFRAAFGDQDDVHLTLKAFAQSNVRNKDADGNILGPITNLKNVSLETRVIPAEQLPYFYQMHHVMIYPSFGEGFGLIPLQAVATGMPSVVTSAWCPYSEFILPLDYKMKDSPWTYQHPGKVSEPDFDNLVDWYRKIYADFDGYSEAAFAAAPEVHRSFNWDSLTQKAFQNIAKKFPETRT